MLNYLIANGDYIIESELPLRPDEKKVLKVSEFLIDKPISTTVQEILKKISEKEVIIS